MTTPSDNMNAGTSAVTQPPKSPRGGRHDDVSSGRPARAAKRQASTNIRSCLHIENQKDTSSDAYAYHQALCDVFKEANANKRAKLTQPNYEESCEPDPKRADVETTKAKIQTTDACSQTDEPKVTNDTLHCPVCLMTFQELYDAQHRIVVAFCGHVLCDCCHLQLWRTQQKCSQGHMTCPMCRRCAEHWHPLFLQHKDHKY